MIEIILICIGGILVAYAFGYRSGWSNGHDKGVMNAATVYYPDEYHG